MSAKTNNTKIGVFVLAAIVLLIGGLLAFGAKSYFEKKALFETAILGDAYGLSVGSPVQLRGVPIGKVTRIDFAWNIYRQSQMSAIVVEFEIEENILPAESAKRQKELVQAATQKGLRAAVKSQGITGTSMLALENVDPTDFPSPAIDFTPRYNYIPSAPAQFTRMLESVEKTLEGLQKLDFAAVAGGLTNTLGVITMLTKKLKDLDLEGMVTNANVLLVDFRGTSTSLRTAVVDLSDTLKRMNLQAIGTNANQLLTGLQQSNGRLQTVLDNVGELPLKQTLGDLRQTLQDLNVVLVQLQRYPSGFIFGEEPKPAKSASK
jgi:ABC-type transporter Mla subunit MlaD